MRNFKKLFVTLSLLTVVTAAAAISASAAPVAYGAGTVTASALNVREGADPASRIASMLYRGNTVVVLNKNDPGWYQVSSSGTVGYASAAYISDVGTVKNFTALGSVAGTGVRMRSQPSTEAQILGVYGTGAAMKIVGINNGWFKVTSGGQTGYIRSDLVTLAAGALPGSGTAPTAPTTVVASAPVKSIGQQIADYAAQFDGYKYIYGASSPSVGFDCSGLTYYVYGHFGYSISRTASQQYKNNGRSVSKEELLPGDLVFFSSDGVGVTHVGLYIGGGKFANASNSRTGVIISSLSSSWYTETYWGAKRIVG